MSLRPYLWNAWKETRHEIVSGLTIGRSKECDLVFNDKKVSAEHFIIVRNESEDILLKDLGSHNRTIINGKKIKQNSSVLLTDKDIIRFGEQKLIFTWQEDMNIVMPELSEAFREKVLKETTSHEPTIETYDELIQLKISEVDEGYAKLASNIKEKITDLLKQKNNIKTELEDLADCHETYEQILLKVREINALQDKYEIQSLEDYNEKLSLSKLNLQNIDQKIIKLKELRDTEDKKLQKILKLGNQIEAKGHFIKEGRSLKKEIRDLEELGLKDKLDETEEKIQKLIEDFNDLKK